MASIEEEDDGRDWTVQGLRLPDPLIALLAAGLWHDPQDSTLRAVMPWFEDPLIFLSSLDQISAKAGRSTSSPTTKPPPTYSVFCAAAESPMRLNCLGWTSRKPSLSPSTATPATTLLSRSTTAPTRWTLG